jgi:hypothetical protein
MPPLNLLTALAIGVGLLAAVALLLAVPQMRRSRLGAFYGTRRDARVRANRRLSAALLLGALAAGLFVVHYVWPELTVEAAITRVAALLQPPTATPEPAAVSTLEPTATRAPASTPTRRPTATATRPVVTATPVQTASLSALPTLTPTLGAALTSTASATPMLGLTPRQKPTVAVAVTGTALPAATPTPSQRGFSAVTPTPNTGTQRLTLRAIGTGVDASGNPAGDGTRFPARTRAIFDFFEYNNVPPSALVKHTWFYNGASAFFRQDVLNRNGVGMASVAWSPEGGFEPGLYEVRVLLGNVPQFVANFEIR